MAAGVNAAAAAAAVDGNGDDVDDVADARVAIIPAPYSAPDATRSTHALIKTTINPQHACPPVLLT